MSEVNRKSIRFFAEAKEAALLDKLCFDKLTDAKTAINEFEPGVVALIANESHNGCSLVLVANSEFYPDIHFKLGKFCNIQLGTLPPTSGEVMRVESLSNEVFSIGFKFF